MIVGFLIGGFYFLLRGAQLFVSNDLLWSKYFLETGAKLITSVFGALGVNLVKNS